MKSLKLSSLLLIFTLAFTGSDLQAKSPKSGYIYSETPAKTVIIKHPAAANLEGFFSSTTVLMFEIYKPGNDLAKIIASLSKNSEVESVNQGPLTGDYQAITLTIKKMKDKQWFAALFKKAGLNTIKINNDPIKKMEEL